MSHITSRSRTASRADCPSDSDRGRRDDGSALGKQRLVVNPYGSEHSAKTARAIVFMEFGHRGAALDQADFVDRKPWMLRTRNL